jgi:hypothetical protein
MIGLVIIFIITQKGNKMSKLVETKRFFYDLNNKKSSIESIKINVIPIGRNKTPQEIYEFYKKILGVEND